jgi:hypothetical protein
VAFQRGYRRILITSYRLWGPNHPTGIGDRAKSCRRVVALRVWMQGYDFGGLSELEVGSAEADLPPATDLQICFGH